MRKCTSVRGTTKGSINSVHMYNGEGFQSLLDVRKLLSLLFLNSMSVLTLLMRIHSRYLSLEICQ